MKSKVEKAIFNWKANPWDKPKPKSSCPLMCWDVTSMFRGSDSDSSIPEKIKKSK